MPVVEEQDQGLQEVPQARGTVEMHLEGREERYGVVNILKP